jgi:hypothetical protein
MVVVRVFEAEGAIEMLLPPRFLRLRCQSAGNRLLLQEGGAGPAAVPEDVHPMTIETRWVVGFSECDYLVASLSATIL